MTSAHPPTTADVGFGHGSDWLWIGLSAILVAMIAGGVMWLITSTDDTTTAALPESVTGFEYSDDATPMHMAEPGVTTPYFGYSGELMPMVAPALVPGFDYDHEVTSMHLVDGWVTTEYYGNSGELLPMVAPALVPGFDYDHEVTPIHMVNDWITTEYYGNSGVLFDED